MNNTTPNYQYFLKTDTSRFRGQWIAMSKNKIVAHGKDAKHVYEQATKKYPSTSISLAKVPKEELLVL